MESLVENRWFAALLTIAVGCACGLLAKRIKVPAGYMIGAFVGVSALSISTGVAWLPTEVRAGVQIVAGAFVGCSLERSDLLRMRGSVRPLLLMLCTFLALNLVLGFAMSAVSSMDLRTALMCAVPGGINDTPIVAAAMGANGPDVTVMQLIRQVLGIGAFPIMIAAFDRALDRRGRPDLGTRDTAAADAKREKSKQRSATSTVVTLAVAVAAGVLGRLSGVPGLTFTASIVAVSVLKLAFDFAYIPKWVKKACQLVAGCYLGTLLTANCFITGKLESRLFGYGRKEGMLIASPAGASDMALIMEDLRVQNVDVVIMQVLRAAVVMALFPQIVNIVCFALGG